MAKTLQEERWRWLKPIINKEMRLVDVAKVCPHSERSLNRWKKTYEVHGMSGLIPKSTEPKVSPKKTPIACEGLAFATLPFYMFIKIVLAEF